MAKSKSSGKGSHSPCEVPAGAQGTRFRDRDLKGVSPLKEQFEPTPASPISNHKQMGGVE